MESKLKLRHFILCEKLEMPSDTDNFGAINIFEYFAAPSYPSAFDIYFVIGVYFLQPGKEYKLQLRTYLNNKLFGSGEFSPSKVDKQDEIMNYLFHSKEFVIPEEGMLRFEIYINGELFDEQYVKAVREEG
jgi:hypothetical protein